MKKYSNLLMIIIGIPLVNVLLKIAMPNISIDWKSVCTTDLIVILLVLINLLWNKFIHKAD